jgi:hypothetical protein
MFLKTQQVTKLPEVNTQLTNSVINIVEVEALLTPSTL